MTSETPMTSGTIPFAVPSADKPCETYYQIHGTLTPTSTPLILLHGGPGCAHEYLLPLTDLWTSHQIPVILYDQLGCGQSTRLREKAGDETFWTIELFIAELENLISFLGLRENGRGFDILGHSWGGMFGGVYASQRPRGLRKLILADAPASVELMLEGVNGLVAKLPADVRRTLEECHEKLEFESERYAAACGEFYKRHLCLLDPWPEEVGIALGHLEEDTTVYKTLYGPSELCATGSLKNWEGFSKADQITAETLLINGRHDEVQDIAVQPWFHAIPKIKWAQLEKSSHTGHWEERERYMQIVGEFLSA